MAVSSVIHNEKGEIMLAIFKGLQVGWDANLAKVQVVKFGLNRGTRCGF